VRAAGVPVRWRTPPAVALLVLGLALTLGPIVGGLFSKVAAGAQLIDRFEPHLEVDALARYDTDLGVLRRGAAAVDAVFVQQQLPDGQFPLLDEYRRAAPGIDERATALLDRVTAAEPDYRRVAAVGGFDRVPFLLVAAGAAAAYGGAVLLGRNRSRARSAVAVVVLAGVAVAAYPFVSSLTDGSRAGARMVEDLAPVMTAEQVSRLQADFVVLVQAVGQLDTAFRAVPQPDQPGVDIQALVTAWPTVSSDLADLVGTINDNLGNYDALDDLDGLVGGLERFPGLLAVVGLATAALGLAALPRRAEARPQEARS
jgi:hypothetical protein